MTRSSGRGRNSSSSISRYYHSSSSNKSRRISGKGKKGKEKTPQQPKRRSFLPSSLAPTASSSEYAHFSERMEESHRHHPPTHHTRRPPHSRMGGVKVAGEIVEVQGGHIVRSTGLKDRHSKVCTAKGPRDRRVRLSAHTAIQFYDVQDRLGYDRPSKAVDWLMKNAKAAIDELEELPAWHPTATTFSSNPPPPSDQVDQEPETAGSVDDSNKKPLPAAEQVVSSAYGFGTTSFLPPSLDSDAIADTIKSFFPIGATAVSSSTHQIGFQNYPTDFMSRTRSQAQDLRLSLQSYQQDPIFLHHHHPTSPAAEQTLFSSSSTPLTFGANSTSWPEQNQGIVSWNAAETGGGSDSGGDNGGGYVFTVPPPQAVSLHPLFGQSHPFLTQRGPLQSSNTHPVRARTDPVAGDHQLGPSVSAIGFAAGGFSGFRIPARIQGEEEHVGISSKPSSASRH